MVELFGVVWSDYLAYSGADDEGLSGCFDDVGCDGVELVDVHDPKDLGHESFDEAEVSAGDPDDGEDRFGVGLFGRVERVADVLPVIAEDGQALVSGAIRGLGITSLDVFGIQRPVLVDEPDPAVEL